MLRHLIRGKLPINLTRDYPVIQFLSPYSTKKDDGLEEVSSKSSNNLANKISSKLNMKSVKDIIMGSPDEPELPRVAEPPIPTHADVVIIGGGAIGSSIAYFLKQRVFQDLTCVVVERDPTYSKASTALSVGGLRQQFSLEENIQMSLFGAEFLRNVNDHLGIEGEPPINVNFHPFGYLMLASEAGVPILENNSKLQNSLGAKNAILKPEKLVEIFPWLNTEGIAAGCYGLEKEGWFDPWSLLCAFKKKATSLGAIFVHGEAKGFKYDDTVAVVKNAQGEREERNTLSKLVVQTPNGKLHEIEFASVVVAAGANSAIITEMADIGKKSGLLSVPLPVEPRKRYVYAFHCPEGPGVNTPLTVDPTGTYFRREDLLNNYVCGRSPLPEEEPCTENLDVDHEFFENRVWPVLAHRVKAFENLKVKSAWAGYYEYNTYDKNGIIGRHPYYANMVIATGFSGHGIQQSPAVGRAITEILLDADFTTIDLKKLGFDRFINSEPMREVNVL